MKRIFRYVLSFWVLAWRFLRLVCTRAFWQEAVWQKNIKQYRDRSLPITHVYLHFCVVNEQTLGLGIAIEREGLPGKSTPLFLYQISRTDHKERAAHLMHRVFHTVAMEPGLIQFYTGIRDFLVYFDEPHPLMGQNTTAFAVNHHFGLTLARPFSATMRESRRFCDKEVANLRRLEQDRARRIVQRSPDDVAQEVLDLLNQ